MCVCVAVVARNKPYIHSFRAVFRAIGSIYCKHLGMQRVSSHNFFFQILKMFFSNFFFYFGLISISDYIAVSPFHNIIICVMCIM